MDCMGNDMETIEIYHLELGFFSLNELLLGRCVKLFHALHRRP